MAGPGDDSLVEWRDWGPAAFDAADRLGRPVLLSVTAPWCEPCREMDAATYADPRVAAHVDDGFVPVRVDADRRPRVRERYATGGFPTTAFLAPDGTVLTAAGYLGPDGMRQVLDSVRETWDAKGASAGTVPRALGVAEPPGGAVTAAVEAHMVEQVAAAFDTEYGGWGEGAKFPLPATVAFAAKRDRDRATRTLEALATHLTDTYGGGFYRVATERDWSGLRREKLADVNAGLVEAFVAGYLYTGEGAYRDAAASGVDYLTTTLWTGEAFAASQAGGDYYTMAASDREAADPPPVDDTVLADRNGLAAGALLGFAAVTDHEAARRYATRALDHVVETLVADGAVAHHDGPDAPTGLLADHARLLAGLTAAAQVAGRDTAVARAVADHALSELDGTSGAFRDGPAGGAGLCDRPLYPVETNAELADALVDLAALTGEERYRSAAGDALAAFADAHDRMGVELAGYAAACARHHDGPLVLETPAAGTDLHRAALRVADHEKVVVPGDRETAVVRRGDDRSAPATTPEELTDRVAATDSGELPNRL